MLHLRICRTHRPPKKRKEPPFWWTLLLYVTLFVLSELLRPKPQLEDAKPSGLGDFQFPTTTEGRSVPLLWGTIQVKGPNVIWYGDLRQIAITKKIKTGLFSSKNQTIGFKYEVGIQFGLCRGPGVQLLRTWVGDDEVFSGTVTHNTTFTVDETELFGGDDLGNGGVQGTFRFFAGEELQPVSSYLSGFQLEGTKTPAYRGTCYLAPDANPIYVGNSTSIKPWTFELRRIPNGLGLTGGDELINGNDANPANVIYEIMTDTDWGLGYEVSDIDVASLTAVAAILATEENGFSYIQDRQMEAIELLKLVEQQIDGVAFLNPITAKWQINLARDDYDIDLVPEILVSNMREMKSFSRSSWEDTTNQVRVEFNDRADEYKVTFALSQDMANQRLQNGINVSVTQKFPGVKDRTLANTIAWRSLRGFSYPLAKAQIIVDRSFFDVQPVQVLAFTDPDLGFNKLPMRVTRINLGQLADNRVVLDLVQDIYNFQLGQFGDPGDTGWEPPVDELIPFLAAQQIAIEAPRGIVLRDPEFAGFVDKIWCGARRVQSEVSYKIVERHSSGTPAGAYSEVGENFLFMFIGNLDSALAAGSAFPLGTLLVTATPDSQLSIEAAFTDTTDLVDIGTNLVNIIMIDGEFMLCEGAQTSGGDVQLNNVWRGVLDSVQADHLSTADVFMLFVGGGITDSVFNPTNNVDIKLLPRSSTDEVLEAAAILIGLTMDNRVRSPYPPSSLRLDATLWASTTSLEANGSDGEDFAIDSSLRRRDYQTVDELAALDVDAPNQFPDYPTENSTDHQIEVRNDPDGANTLLFTDTFTIADHDVLRIDILNAMDGVLPTRLRFVIRSRHTLLTVMHTSVQELVWDFDVTSALTGQFEFGGLDTDDTSESYTADAAGQHDFTLTSTFTAGDVEYRIDTGGGFGAWTQLIAAAASTGNIAGVSVSDIIQVRHRSSDSGALKQLDMAAPGAGTDAFAILFV